jgi:hypothetical protein
MRSKDLNSELFAPFQAVLISGGIIPLPITVKNLQANTICKCFHSTTKNQVHTIIHSNSPQDIGDMNGVINSAIACYSLFASPVAVH